MKRLAISSMLLVALAVPALVPASTELATVSAKAKRGFGSFSIAFEIRFKGNKPKKVGNFVFDDIPLECTEGLGSIDGSGFGAFGDPPPNDPAKVEDGKFKKAYQIASPDSGKFKIGGEFRRHNQKVRGKLSIVDADFPAASRTNCNSGALSYTAKV